MKTTLIAMVMAAGLGLAGTSSSFAAPASGTVLRGLDAATSNIQDVRWCRTRCWHRGWSRRFCNRWCGGGY
jgi:hypothetical protein